VGLGWLNSQRLELMAESQKTHRLSAWGVLGSTTDGLPFLLTHPVVFRSHYWVKTHPGKKVSGRPVKFLRFPKLM
jgi:hypothetical protein